MPRGGHNAKPTSLHILNGNPGKRPLNTDEPKPAIVPLAIPSHLDRYARYCWRQNAGALQTLGLLTEIDRDLFALYCDAYSQWRTASKSFASLDPIERADTYRKVAVSVEKARDQMRMIAGEFGMSPSSRARLKVAPQQEEDPFESFMSGNKRA